MSTGGLKKRYTSAMEKIIKNAVSETSKVLETIIAELKAEVLRVKSENENLKIRCSQFEEVVKKRSVYRETGTSPEPYIIEKCDKAVQCDLALRQPEDLDPNLSDNETQSERSYGPIYEKESSNDSFSFTTIDDDEQSTYDVSDKITSEKSFDQETNTNINRPAQKNMENDKHLEPPTCSSEQESPQVELNEEHESCCGASEMEIQEACQEDFGTECAKIGDSLLECQERQKDLKERTTISLQEDVHISTEKVVAICEKSKPEESEDRLFPDLSNENTQQQVGQERTEMDVQIDPESKLSSFELIPTKASSADTTIGELGNSLVQSDNTDVSSVQDQLIISSKVSSSVTPEPEFSGAKIAGKAVQSVSTEDVQSKKAHKMSPTLKYPYFLRRQRCTSVTLEDAMLLLDAVNLHEYKSSTPKKAQTKHSVRTTKIGNNNPELSPTFAKDSTQLKEKAFNAETLQPLAPETAEIIKEAGPASRHVECQQHDQETIPHAKPSLEAVIDQSVLMVTPLKVTLVTEADSASMEIEDKHKVTSTNQSSLPDINNVTPATTPAKQSETTQAVENDTVNMNIEGREHDQITATSPAKPVTVEPNQNVTIVPPVMTSVTQSKQDHVVQEVEMIECPSEMDIDSQSHDYRSWSLLPPTASSSVAPGVDDKAVLLSTPTEQGETAQAPADLETQNDLVNLTPPIVVLPSDPVSESDRKQANPDETESVAQICGNPTLHSEGKENEASFSLALSPPKPPHNPKTQHTLLLKMPGDTGDLCSSVLKTITSSSTLSPAQLSAVVSAVRSTQNTGSSSGPSQSTPSNKKLVAVPFSLQSVMKPHHKIIVIPRQCKIPPSQPIAKDKAIVLKKNPFQIDSTTTVISTSDVNLDPCFGNSYATPELNKQQPALDIKETSPVQETSPCKNTVQVKLNRLSFPALLAQPLSVTNMSPGESSTSQKNPPSRPPVKTIIPETARPEAQPAEAQLAEANLTCPVIDTSSKMSNKMNKPIQTSRRRRVKSTGRSSNVVRLSPVVSSDHSYPQHRMTKSQFLAKLEVSPVTQDSEKAGSSGKDVQKASLVDRLRSHLKKVQDVSNLTVETTDHTCITQETCGPNQEQQSENLSLLDTVPHFDENTSASPIKTSPVTKSVASVKEKKRKNCPKTDSTPAKPVKKRRLKKSGASSENIPLRGNLAPMRNKLINSNALLSCVRKGLSKKSFLCKFCRKEFSKKKDIEEHIQVHAGKKPFQCNICHRRFSRTMELSRHLKRHNAEKKYHCSFCGKAFIEYNNLKRHTYIHTGEKPFSCPHCPKAFTQSGHMRTHIKSHHKDIKKQ